MNIKAKTDQREPKARSMIVKRRRCRKFSFSALLAAKLPSYETAQILPPTGLGEVVTASLSFPFH
jgi:hypothetical protein